MFFPHYYQPDTVLARPFGWDCGPNWLLMVARYYRTLQLFSSLRAVHTILPRLLDCNVFFDERIPKTQLVVQSSNTGLNCFILASVNYYSQMSNCQSAVIRQYLSLCGYSIPATLIDLEVQSHPDFPNLNAITESLKRVGIEAEAARVEKSILTKMEGNFFTFRLRSG